MLSFDSYDFMPESGMDRATGLGKKVKSLACSRPTTVDKAIHGGRHLDFTWRLADNGLTPLCACVLWGKNVYTYIHVYLIVLVPVVVISSNNTQTLQGLTQSHM